VCVSVQDDVDTMADQQVFATPDNVGSASKYLLNSLAGVCAWMCAVLK